MSLVNKLYVEFGIPEHGWLPALFRQGDLSLKLDISDVPVDPMAQLCEALIELIKGTRKSGRITWHLEPYCYHLQLGRSDIIHTVTVLESDEFDGPTKMTTEISGTFEDVTLPFYKAFEEFCSKSFEPPHWNKLDPNRIETLTQLVKEKKTQDTLRKGSSG